jgi:hypothetical protein
MKDKKVIFIIIGVVLLLCCCVSLVGLYLIGKRAQSEGKNQQQIIDDILKGDNSDTDDSNTTDNKTSDYKDKFTGAVPAPGSGWKTFSLATKCSTYSSKLALDEFSVNYPNYFETYSCSAENTSNYVSFYNYDDYQYLVDNVVFGYLNVSKYGDISDSDLADLLTNTVLPDQKSSFPAGSTFTMMDDSNLKINGIDFVRQDYDVYLSSEYSGFAKSRFFMRLLAVPNPTNENGVLLLSFAEISKDKPFNDGVQKVEDAYLTDMQSSMRFGE